MGTTRSTPNPATRQPAFILRGRHVLLVVLLFFGTVIAVNTLFVVLALRTFPGEDVPRSFLQGLRFNETLAARRAQRALGWRASIEAVQGAGTETLFHLRLVDRTGAPINSATLTGQLRRPADTRFDRPLTFEPLGSGLYVARAGVLARGIWEVEARTRVPTPLPDTVFEVTSRVILP